MKNRVLELGQSITLMLWGIWVGNIFFETFPAAKVFTLMNQIASEEVWGVSLFLVGAIQLAFLYTKYNKISCFLALLGMFAFIILTIFYAIGNWASTAAPMYFAMSIYSALAFAESLEIKRNT